MRWLEYLLSSFSEGPAATETAAPVLGTVSQVLGITSEAEIWPSVTVAVDEIHATLVAGILNQHGPLELEEREAQSHRR